MCLRTLWTKPKIASEDIYVYKILENTLISPFLYFQYELGKLYKTRMRKKGYVYIENGFHAYRNIKTIERLFQGKDEEFNELYGIFEAVIPKGSKYFHGNEGDIVSNKIIIKEKVCV